MRCVRYGPNALLFRFADEPGDAAYARGRAIAAVLESTPPAGMIEFVPAFTSVLVTFQTATECAAARQGLLQQLQRAAVHALPAPAPKEIRVFYDGADLEKVAAVHELSTDEVIELHSAVTYKVYMLGFSPGFPYLGDLDPRLHTPRLATPRQRVPAGSVAIGGIHTGIYSIEGPGGWNIIGRTSIRLFEPEHVGDDMFFLHPGDLVRFVPQEPQ